MLSDPDLGRKEVTIRAWTTTRVATVLTHLQQQPGRPSRRRHSRAVAPVPC